MVIAWLINSMVEEIGQLYLFFPAAKEIWDVAKETYSNLGNSAQVLEIKSKLREIKQGLMFLTQFHDSLTKLWEELDLLG